MAGWIFQRNKWKVTLAGVTQEKGCLGYTRPYKWALRAILFYFHTLSSSVNKGFRSGYETAISALLSFLLGKFWLILWVWLGGGWIENGISLVSSGPKLCVVQLIMQTILPKSLWVGVWGSSYMFIITVEPCVMATPFTQPPCYYGHFILGRNLKNPSNMATLWSDFCGPWATGLTEFHCNLKLSMLVVCKIFVPHRGENEFWAITHKTKFFTVHFRSDVHNLQ